MSPALDERTAPDAASGAVLLHPVDPRLDPAVRAAVRPAANPAGDAGAVPPWDERDFWRAVAATVLATLSTWLR